EPAGRDEHDEGREDDERDEEDPRREHPGEGEAIGGDRQRRSEEEEDDPGSGGTHQRTGTRRRMSPMRDAASCGSSPSRGTMRWERTSTASAWMSSGVTYPRPARTARTLAVRSSWTPARGDEPSAIAGSLRVASSRDTTQARSSGLASTWRISSRACVTSSSV